MTDSTTTHKPYPYPANPTRVRATRRILRILANAVLFHTIFKIEVSGLDKIPRTGPTMIIFNHINFSDPLIVGCRVRQRDLVGLGKIELKDNPIMAFISWGFGLILIRRGEVDMTAFRRCLEVLNSEDALMIAPEGHRNRDGLRNPQEGTAMLAAKAGAVIVPIGISGSEDFLANIKRLRRTVVTFNVGEPFKLKSGVRRQQYSQVMDEMMYRIAPLIKPHLRGLYGDQSKATMETIESV